MDLNAPMPTTLREAYDTIESLGAYIAHMNKTVRDGRAMNLQVLKISPIALALELVAVRDVVTETIESLSRLEYAIKDMLKTLERIEALEQRPHQ
jgi:hypothetical protein